MNRSNKIFLTVAHLALLLFAAPAVLGFDLPKPKKEKKKDANSDDANSGDAQPAPQTKTDNAAKSDDGGGNKQQADAPPPSQPTPVQSMELKYPKSLWESSGAKDMKVGDWVETEMTMMAGSKSRQDVVEVGDHFTVVQTKQTMMGQTSEQKIKTIYSEPDADEKEAEKQRKELKIEVKEVADKITVKGKELAATRHEVYQDGKLTSKTWMSKDVPLGGVVKCETGEGQVISQVTDFGRGK